MWVPRVMEEFFRQGDLEAEMGYTAPRDGYLRTKRCGADSKLLVPSSRVQGLLGFSSDVLGLSSEVLISSEVVDTMQWACSGSFGNGARR